MRRIAVAICFIALLLWFARKLILAAKPYARWSIMVSFNALISVGFIPIDSMSLPNIIAIILAVLTFIPLYVMAESYLSSRYPNAIHLKQSLFCAALIKGSLQFFMIIHVVSGVIAIAVVEFLGPWFGAHGSLSMENFGPVAYYFTTFVDGVVLSAGVAVLALVINTAIRFWNYTRRKKTCKGMTCTRLRR